MTTHPSTAPARAVREAPGPDVLRQVVVVVSAVLAVVGSFLGSGALGGTPIQDAAGGALSASSTPVAPDGPAFSIWSVIYTGLLAYAVWQALPAQRAMPRHRALGYPVAASLLLNAAWILSVQAGQLALSVVVIAALLAVLAHAFRVAVSTRTGRIVEAVVTDGTIGLYLGWVSIATVANVAAALGAAGWDGAPLTAEAWGIVMLVVAALVGLLVAVWGRGRLAPAAALSWGLAWIAVGRATGELVLPAVSVTAGIAATVVVLGTVAVRLTARER